MARHFVSVLVTCVVLCLCGPSAFPRTSLVGQNVNMVSGTDWTTGRLPAIRCTEPNTNILL